jgi:hypothetical protein
MQYLLTKGEYDQLQFIIAYLVHKQGGTVDIPSYSPGVPVDFEKEKLFDPFEGASVLRITTEKSD